MTSKKLFYILVVIIVLMTGSLVGGAYGASILLQKESQKLVDIRTTAAALDQQQIQLTKAKNSVAQYQEIGKIAENIVPQDKSQAQTVRELVDIAQKNNIKLASISFPTSTLGTAAAAGAKTTTKADLSQLTPVKTLPGLYTLQIIVQSDAKATIPYDKFIAFLNDLEHNRRTALVSSISLTPDPKNASRVSFTINLDEYIKP